MPSRPLLLIATIGLAACSSPEEVAERTGTKGAGASASASAGASGAGRAVKVNEDTSLYSYVFSYPAVVGAIPALAARLEDGAAKAKSEMIAEAKSAQADARTHDYTFNPHGYGEEWQVVADLPDYLSLSNAFHTYTGGAHGMYGMQGLVWDKANQRAMASEDLFQSPVYLGATMGDALCDALNAERAERRGEPVDPKDEMFGGCPGLDEATILVGSADGKTFDRVTVWYGPYVAGSYAEGAYELDFPMTAAMLEAVKPAYRAAFSAKR